MQALSFHHPFQPIRIDSLSLRPCAIQQIAHMNGVAALHVGLACALMVLAFALPFALVFALPFAMFFPNAFVRTLAGVEPNRKGNAYISTADTWAREADLDARRAASSLLGT